MEEGVLTDPRRGGKTLDERAGHGEPDLRLLPLARLIGREIRLRRETVGFLDEARWTILLDIFLATAEGRAIPFMSAAHASSAPVSTAQRYIHDMIETGLIVQDKSGADQRIVHVRLTERGMDLVNGALAGMMALRARG